jgi:hypothetical protein
MRTAAQGGRWLLPWACVLVLSGSLAQAAEQALVGNPRNRPVELVATTQPDTDTALAGVPAGAAQWVLLTSLDATGAQTRLHCLTTRDRVAADVLEVHAADLRQVASELCQTTRD